MKVQLAIMNKEKGTNLTIIIGDRDQESRFVASILDLHSLLWLVSLNNQDKYRVLRTFSFWQRHAKTCLRA